MAEMERAIEATGADVEAAIAAGLARLGVDQDDADQVAAVEIKVLDEGKRGVLGLGARDARVRLTPKVKPMPQQPPVALAEPVVEPVGPAVAEEPVTGLPQEPQERGEAEISRRVLLELLALMGVEKAQVDVRRAEPAEGEREPPLILDVDGPGTDVLVGRRGKTLAALQHITRLIVGREMAGWVHLVIDVGGFKARREQSLHRIAHRMAAQATRTGRRVVLEPMPPHERRIVHLALRDHPDVVTESIGEGERRKVTIIPR